MSGKSIEEVLEARRKTWMALPEVVGTGIGKVDDRPCIKVFVTRKTSLVEKTIPESVEGFPVLIEETGRFRPRE